jgi:ribosome-associated toxin RatA of RatAB toxin-antitoxin module
MLSHYTFSEKTAYTAEQWYTLVNDIERYPEFLPGCQSVEILHQEGNTLSAKLLLILGPAQYEAESHNILNPPSEIHMRLGKTTFFKEAHAAWFFKKIDEISTEVRFDLTIEWKNFLSGKLFGKAIEKAAPKIIPLFLKEAQKRYGHPSL